MLVIQDFELVLFVLVLLAALLYIFAWWGRGCPIFAFAHTQDCFTAAATTTYIYTVQRNYSI